MEHVIALDVGGTGMKGALVDAEGEVSHHARRHTPRGRGAPAVVAAILDFAGELAALGADRFGSPARAAGVAVPGIVDERTGIAVHSANLGWRDVPLGRLLGDRLAGIPVAVGHDVRAGGLAEGRIGAGRGSPRHLFVALGTGIAAAVGVDGRVEAGAHGRAGEIGHLVVRPGGAACPCGGRGCLERYASAAAVGAAWAGSGGGPGADAADCAAAVEAGDARAARVWADAVDALADGLVAAITLLDPGRVIVGGGLAESGETLLAPLRSALGRRVTFQRTPEIVPAALGDTAGCLGAGLLAWDLQAGAPTPGRPASATPVPSPAPVIV
ncbi:ROK family protein [Streptomyces sp. ZYX-F-203]